MPAISVQNFISLTCAGATVFVSSALLLRKSQRILASVSRRIYKAGTGNAGVDTNRVVIDNLSLEVTRLIEANTSLTKMVNDFKMDNIELRSEITELRVQLAALTRLISASTDSCST